MSLIFLVGGASSGKSSLALGLARELGTPVSFVATAEGRDAEMVERIARHQGERPAEWTTIEEPVDLLGALQGVPSDEGVIIDCLTLWVANVIERHVIDQVIVSVARSVAIAARARTGPTIVISNEVGSGIVPNDALSRRYRDLLGRVNATFASAADQAFLVVAGQVLELGAPQMQIGGQDRR